MIKNYLAKYNSMFSIFIRILIIIIILIINNK